MTQTEFHVWPYRVSRQDEALEFISFQYNEDTPGISVRVRIDGEQAHVTTPRDLDPQERDDFIESVRENFRTANIELAFETVFEASRQPEYNRPIPDLQNIDQPFVSESDRLAFLRWELGAHLHPVPPRTEGDIVALLRERFTRDAGDVFQHYDWAAQRDLVRVIDTGRNVLEQEAALLSRLEQGPLNEHVYNELVSQIQIGLLDYELLSDDFLSEYEAPNSIVSGQTKRIFRVAGEQMDDALARIESYATGSQIIQGAFPEYILDPGLLNESIATPEEFLPLLSAEHQAGFAAIEAQGREVRNPELLFPKSYLPAYEQACRYLALKPETGAAGMQLVTGTGLKGQKFLEKVWSNLAGIDQQQFEVLQNIAHAMGRAGTRPALDFLCNAMEGQPEDHDRSDTRAIAHVRRSAALEGLKAAGESEQVFAALNQQYEKRPYASDPMLLEAISVAAPEKALVLFRENLRKSFLHSDSDHLGVMLKHIAEHGDPTDLSLLFSIYPFTGEQQDLLDKARLKLIAKEPSWFRRMGYRIEQLLSSRAEYLGTEEWGRQFDQYSSRYRRSWRA